MYENRNFYQLGRIQWALHQIDGVKGFIEIDVRPSGVENKTVIGELFSTKKLPHGAVITSSLGFSEDRIKINFRKCGYNPIISTIKSPFCDYLVQTSVVGDQHLYISGWRRKFALKAREYAERKAIQIKWQNTPLPALGGLTPDQLLHKGYGPWEVKGVGFVWVGIDPLTTSRATIQIQTRPYSDDKNFNKSIRWFLQRGTSLDQALKLNSQHMGALNKQALIGSITVLLGALKMMPGRKIPLTRLDKLIHLTGEVDKSINATAKAIKRSDIGAKLTKSAKSIEQKVQLLNESEAIAVPLI